MNIFSSVLKSVDRYHYEFGHPSYGTFRIRNKSAGSLLTLNLCLGETWFQCTLCDVRTKKKKVMLTHGMRNHRRAKSYSCSACSYENSIHISMVYHLNTYHPGDDDVKINCFYRKVC